MVVAFRVPAVCCRGLPSKQTTTVQNDIALTQSVAHGSTEKEKSNSHWGQVVIVMWKMVEH